MHVSHRGKEAARAFHIKRGRRRGAAHLLSGLGSWSSRRLCPPIMGWGTVASPIPSILLARHAGGRQWRRETGPSLIGAAGRSRFPAPLWPDCPSGAAEPRPRPFIRRGRGMPSHVLPSSISFHFRSFLPSAMARGGAGPSTVAARVAARQRVPPSQELAAVEPATRGRGGGEVEVAVALGEEGDGAAFRPRPRQRCLPRWRSTSGTSPVTSSSGCAGHHIIVFVSLPHSLRRWSSTRPRPSGCT